MSNAENARRIIEQIPFGTVDTELLHPEFLAWTNASGDMPAGQYSYHFLLAFDGGLLREIREYLDPAQHAPIRPLLAL
jgi:hypothetical protein